MLTLTPAQTRELRQFQRSTRERHEYVRVTVVLMIAGGFAVADVADALGIDAASVYRYAQAYPQAATLAEFVQRHYVPYAGRLTAAQAEQVRAYVHEEWRLTAAGIADWVRQQVGVSYSAGGMAGVLHRLGFAYKYTHLVPAKADVAQQQAFLDQVLVPLLAQADPAAAATAPVVYFADAVHPQHNTRPERGWIAVGETFAVASNSGRQRLTLSAALNAHDVTDVLTHESARANAEASIALLEAVRARRDETAAGRPVVVVCDNASCWHAATVRDWLARRPDCRLCFLPPYSPNLNLIERLWKYLRKEVISSFYTPKFSEFADRIRAFFSSIADHKAALHSLLTLRFAVAAA